MAISSTTELKELNIKLFELMEAVKGAIDNQKGTETFFYPFRGNNFRGSRSIEDGFFFPGQESPYASPYVVLHYSNGKGHYQIHITKDNKGNYSSDIGIYNDALNNKNTDFASYGFIVDQQKTYIVKDENWVNFKQKMIGFFSAYEQLFVSSSKKVRDNYKKNIGTIKKIVSQTAISNNTIKGTQVSPLGNVKVPLNQILYGPPGTGKTYNTVNKALEIIDGISQHNMIRFKQLKSLGHIEFITFHQSMSYEDFVEGIKPITTGQQVTYDVRPGMFKQICEKAEIDPENNYVLIIDEINRGNVSQIFGELITLIEKDKRLGEKEELTVKLPYSSTCVQTGQQVKEFGVPKNLYIIGTMNTADRSVEALDTALRRRFFFEEMMPDPTLLNCTITDNNNHNYCTLEDLLLTINSRLEVLKDRDHLIGHSYFMKFNGQASVLPDDLRDVFHYEIIPLLQEYFYGDYEKILMILGDGFVDKINNQSNPVVFAAGGLSYSQPNYIYRLKPISGVNMLGALSSMQIQNWIP